MDATTRVWREGGLETRVVSNSCPDRRIASIVAAALRRGLEVAVLWEEPLEGLFHHCQLDRRAEAARQQVEEAPSSCGDQTFHCVKKQKEKRGQHSKKTATQVMRARKQWPQAGRAVQSNNDTA